MIFKKSATHLENSQPKNAFYLQEIQAQGMDQRLREWPTNNWPNLKPILSASTNR